MEASEVASAAEIVEGFAAAAASVAIEVVSVAEEEESVTKAVGASAEEVVGMAAAAAALVMAQHLPPTHLLDQGERAVEASAAAVIRAHLVDQ